MIADDNGDLKSKLMGNDSFPPTYKQLVPCGCTRGVLDLMLCVQLTSYHVSKCVVVVLLQSVRAASKHLFKPG